MTEVGDQQRQTPNADVCLTREAAARLIEAQIPSFVPAQPEPLGEGWDNTAFLVNGRAVFRFPRRREAVELILQEPRALPLLAPHLPLPIPVPQWVGEPGDAYPYPFVGHPFIPGTTACRVAWSDEERAANAGPLGRFLGALHRLPISEAARAWAIREPGSWAMSPLRERLAALRSHLPGQEPERLADLDAQLGRGAELLDRARVTGPQCWVHGDLYVRHLLVDEDHQLCGVIDWGDVHVGNPAIDLMIAWSFLPPHARPAFQEAYGPIDPPTWERARQHALHYGVSLIECGDADLRREGRYALWAAGMD